MPCPEQAQHGFKSLVAIGDGATDLEAAQPGGADIFIGCAPLPGKARGVRTVHMGDARVPRRFGGSVYRSSVAEAADWYVISMQPLLDALR